MIGKWGGEEGDWSTEDQSQGMLQLVTRVDEDLNSGYDRMKRIKGPGSTDV